MNLYTFLIMYSFSVTSIFTYPSRLEIAKRRYLEALKNEDNKPNNPNDPQVRKQRNSNVHDRQLLVFEKLKPQVIKTTTTTKSPQQMLEEKKAKEQKRNPKGIASPVLKEIADFTDKLKKLEKQCTKNTDCSSNNTCCMKDAGEPHYCMKMPGHYQRCSELCPCSGKMECKVKEEINEEGQPTYNKVCLKRTEPESTDITGMVNMGFQKAIKAKETPSGVNKRQASPLVGLQS